MNLRKSVILVVYFGILTQCKNRGERVLVDPLDSTYIKLETPNPLYGEWRYSFPFYSSELTIDQDGSFKFHEQGCMGHGYTEGTWKRSGDYLVLKSYDRFHHDTIPIIYETKTVEMPISSNTSKIKKRKSKSKNSKLRYAYSFDLSTINFTATTTFKLPDTSNYYFDHKLVRISKDFWLKLIRKERRRR